MFMNGVGLWTWYQQQGEMTAIKNTGNFELAESEGGGWSIENNEVEVSRC